MSVVTIRDVPDDDLELVRQRAREEHKSLAAFVRDLLAAEAAETRRRNQLRAARARLSKTQRRFDLGTGDSEDGVEAVRAVRDALERGGE